MKNQKECILVVEDEGRIRRMLVDYLGIRDYHVIDGITFINPGAISFARDDYYYSYAIIDINEERIDVDFKQLDEE